MAPTLDQLERLNDRQHRKALGLAHRILGDTALAEEVVQDVFLAIWRSGSTNGRPDTWIQTFVLSMVHERATEVRNTCRLPAAVEDSVDITAAEQLDRLADSSTDATRIRQLLAVLPEEQRQALELAHLGGLTHRALAARLGLAPVVVQRRIRLALDQLGAGMCADTDGGQAHALTRNRTATMLPSNSK